jgi:alpha-beta hydrolase superfamily lysophospholipase
MATCREYVSADSSAAEMRPAPNLGEALYFDSGPHALFGWLHRAAAAKSSGLGLILCNPFGYEAVCAHRGVRALAEAAAARGIHALRFDYSGTGDSADIEPQSDQLEAWTQDVAAAAAELQRRTGVDRVCLLGIRLGALLATLAAPRCRGVAGLILIAPVISGRRYLRELRTTRLAAALRIETGESAGEPLDSESTSDGSLEVGGFAISAATQTALAHVDLAAPGAAAAPAVLLLDNINAPAARAWSEVLSALGVETRYLALPGLIEMAITAPQAATVPHAMVAAVLDWLQSIPAASDGPETSAPPLPVSRTEDEVLTLVGAGPRRAALTERPVFLDPGVMIFGIVTEPRRGESRRRGVILLNAAADYHIGAGRIYVSLARSWARRGYCVLRLDFAGVGDSATRPGHPDDAVFPADALQDIRAAIDYLRIRYGIGDVTLAGLCSGAYHALRAAVAELPVSRILMVNPLNFFWKKGMALSELQLAEVVRFPAVYRERLFSFRHWGLLLTGRVSIWRIIRVYVRRVLLALESALREWARALRIQLPQDLGTELQRIAARGVRVVFVFARGEPGIGLLKLQAGSTVAKLGDRCRVHIIDSGDHIFGRRAPRSILEKILSDELFAAADHSAGGASF